MMNTVNKEFLKDRIFWKKKVDIIAREHSLLQDSTEPWAISLISLILGREKPVRLIDLPQRFKKSLIYTHAKILTPAKT